MIFKVKDREYTIKYGYKATANSGIMTRVAEFEEESGNREETIVNLMVSMEETMKVLAEMLLVGLQRFHEDEFGVDFDTDYSKSASIDKVYDLLDEYFDDDEADLVGLYTELEKELVANGFLSKMFQEEQKKAKTTKKTTKSKSEAEDI